MMNYKTKLLRLIGDAQIDEFFNELDSLLMYGRLYADFVHYKSRYKEIKRSNNRGTLEYKEYVKEMNQLNDALIAFVDEIDESEYLRPILLLSPNQQANDSFAPALLKTFPNAVTDFSGCLVDKDFAFIVCNDFETPTEAFDLLMQEYIDKGFYLVCYTKLNQKKLVSDNRLKVNAANTPFTLYSRIKEMIDFVRYFKA
jgi:hypothetical protein